MAFPVVASATSDGSKPSGLAVGDLLVIGGSCFINGTPGAPLATAPGISSGWTTAAAHQNDGVFYKIADATDVAASSGFAPGLPGTSGGSTADSSIVFALRITGADVAAAVQALTDTSFSGSTALTSGITITGRQCLLIMIENAQASLGSVNNVSSYAVVNSNPTWTEILDNQAHGTVSSKLSQSAAAWGNHSGTLGASTGNATAANSSAQFSGYLYLLAIQPPKLTTSSVIMQLVVNAATVIGRVIGTTSAAMHLILGTPVLSHLTSMWKNQGKSSAAWEDTPKSLSP